VYESVGGLQRAAGVSETDMKVVCDTVSLQVDPYDNSFVIAVETNLTSELQRLRLNITNDYYSAFRRSKIPSYTIAADKYLTTSAAKWKDKSLLCPEMPLPRHLVPNVRLITHRSPIWSRHAVAFVHAGRCGSVTPVHFDWDHAWVAHACLVGRKRFVLIPPTAGWLLSPTINTSALLIPRFAESDRAEILATLGGTEFTLEAGQGILFPSMFWHGAIYEEPTLAVSVRFEHLPGGRPFSALPRSWLLQRLVWHFFREDYEGATDFLHGYLKSFFTNTRTWKERYRRVADFCRKCLLAQGQQQGAFEWVAESFSTELAIAQEELKGYYGNVDARNRHERKQVLETRRFLFNGIEGVSRAQELRLAKHALSMRQGLPPKRGLVEIEQE
jgi:hypothetical protein